MSDYFITPNRPVFHDFGPGQVSCHASNTQGLGGMQRDYAEPPARDGLSTMTGDARAARCPVRVDALPCSLPCEPLLASHPSRAVRCCLPALHIICYNEVSRGRC